MALVLWIVGCVVVVWGVASVVNGGVLPGVLFILIGLGLFAAPVSVGIFDV